MKLTIFLITIACLQVSAAAFSQNISLKEKNAPINHILDQIQQQSGYEFFYDSDAIKLAGNVTIDLKNVTVQQALDEIFREKPFSYSINDKTIVIKTKEENLLEKLGNKIKTALAIPITITGTVLDEENKPLPGVTVREKNTGNIVATNSKGEFSLIVPDKKTIVVFSFVGYETLEISAEHIESPATIVLKVGVNNLHEVIINKGYYNERQALSTGDVTIVSAKIIEKQPVSNPLAALEGRVPGLLISQTTGLPGGGFTVQIRGKGSIANGTDPLYVVDGVPYSSQLPGGLLNSTLQGGNPLNFINPYDIESIEVLKDADATTIYGSRAANGAIIITTKKGKAGDMKVSLDLNSGFTQPAHDIKLLNTQQYLAMRHEAFKNDNATPGINDHDINGDWDTTRYTDWTKVLTRNTAHYTNANVSISGGNTNTQYLIGAGYNRQTTGFPTLLPNDGADQKGSVHFNINTFSPNKKLNVTLTASYVTDNNTVQSVDFTLDRLMLAPDAPAIFNTDGSLNWAPLVPGGVGTWPTGNPFAGLYQKYQGTTNNIVGNAVISYKLLPGLEIKTSLGYTNTQTDEVQTVPTTSYDPGRHIASGNSSFNEMNTHSWIIEPQADYKLKLGHGILSALVGASFHENNNGQKYNSASGFSSDALLEDLQAASSIYAQSNSAQYKYEAVFGRLNYNWEDKYLLNLTGRRDGSSRFGPGKQFANFGAVGAGWIFSQEDFIKQNLPFLSFGKLRVSYGTTGNDQVGDYKFIDLYTTTNYPYQGMQGLYPKTLFNPDLAWETTRKLEGGIELGFFKDRITIQASFYRNRSDNQLVQTPISAVTGFFVIPSNLPAVVQNTGKEFEINTININANSFKWSSSLNLTIARNKLISFTNLASSSYANYFIIGQPISIIKAFHYTGVNENTGLYQFASSNGGNTASPDFNKDRSALVDLTPTFYGGFQNSFAYKGFTLDVFFQFTKQKGQKFWAAYGTVPGTFSNQPIDILNRWQTPGDNKPFQQFSQLRYGDAGNALSYEQQSDFAYGDASFIRLKNMSISWALPEGWQKKIHLSNCRIYLQGQNLLTITKYDGIDPESRGLSTPPVRVWTAGLGVGF